MPESGIGSAEPAASDTPNPQTPTAPASAAPRTEDPPSRDHDSLAFLRELPVLILVAFALAILLKTLVVQAFFIPSSSMEPTLMPGDRVLVQKVLYTPERGDIIVFEDPDPGPGTDRGIVAGFLHWLSEAIGFARPEDEDFIKRVIGLPGEVVELRDGRLLVDGVEMAQPYLGRGARDTRDYGPKKVPRNALFVLGDNRLHSNDSRFALGFVPLDKVVGKAFVVIWPPSRVGWLR